MDRENAKFCTYEQLHLENNIFFLLKKKEKRKGCFHKHAKFSWVNQLDKYFFLLDLCMQNYAVNVINKENILKLDSNI